MKRLAVCIGALVLIGCSVWFIDKYFGIEAHAIAVRLWPPPSVDKIETRQLRKIAGWFSLDCGYVRHHENADAAISCATSALRARKSFYVSFDFVGIDSRGVIGVAANRSGEVFQVTTDQLGGGYLGMVATSGIVRTLTVSRCGKPPFEERSYPSNRYLVCRVARGN